MILPSSVDQLSDRDTNDKLGTPVQSIDSAVESLDDSPDSQHRHSSIRHSGEQLIGGGNGKYAEELSVQLNRSLAAWKMGGETSGGGVSLPLPPSSASTQTVGTVGIGGSHRPPPEAVSTTSSGHEPGWDSGLSSSDTVGGGDFCGCSCQDPRNSNNNNNSEDWVRILEALETVGEAEMLRKLEESIMGGTVPQCDHGGPSSSCRPAGSSFALNNALTGRAHYPGAPMFTNTILRHPPLASSSTAQLTSSLRAETDSLSLNSSASGASMSDLPPPMPPPKPPRPTSTSIVDSRLEAILKGLESIPYMTSPTPGPSTSTTSNAAVQRGNSLATPVPELCTPSTSGATNGAQQPLEIHRVTLHKDSAYNDFGFSVSDGDNDSGVYINKIRPGGPAYNSGNVRPFDRILQVNDTSLQFLDCILTVPLLLSATNKIDLLLCRDPFGAVNRHAPIAEEDEASIVSTKDSAV
uniref:PDZ domain-containing protein n=1 Tax=Plectus sambesii TaxID=2011161 RepID=A0A914X7J2_9BILA